MKQWPDLGKIRREYGTLSLSVHSTKENPVEQFQQWFDEAMQVEKSDPTAMVLATVDREGYPDARVVLLKGVVEDRFIFYTNYKSAKGKQIAQNPLAALNFYWPQMARQVRIQGQVSKVSSNVSDKYFHSRPFMSQVSAVVSAQSSVLSSREALGARIKQCEAQHQSHSVERPTYWGGYQLEAQRFEFWQGRDNRLHDRIAYHKEASGWERHRLAP